MAAPSWHLTSLPVNGERGAVIGTLQPGRGRGLTIATHARAGAPGRSYSVTGGKKAHPVRQRGTAWGQSGSPSGEQPPEPLPLTLFSPTGLSADPLSCLHRGNDDNDCSNPGLRPFLSAGLRRRQLLQERQQKRRRGGRQSHLCHLLQV